MFRYVIAAFWASPEISGLGKLPLNVVALIGFLILGFGHPGFWFLAAALETVYLYALTSSARFRRLVDAEELQIEQGTTESQRQALIASLAKERRERLKQLESKYARALKLYRDTKAEDWLVVSNREAFQQIAWLYLKLLVAQQNLLGAHNAADEMEIRKQIDLIEKDLRYDKLSPSLKESKQATLAILQQRLANLARREQSLEEVESDLNRIDAQIDLAVENAGMRGVKPEAVSSNIKLVSQLLDESLYGASGASIAAIDPAFHLREAPPQKPPSSQAQ